MSKSRARLLAELLNSAGRVKKDKSDLAGADSVIDLDTLPTITNAKLENSSVTIAGEAVSLGASLSLNTGHISEHTNYKYYTDARVRAAISVDGSLSYNSSTGVFSYTTPTTIASLSNHDTADLAEGTNLYYTDARARGAISVSGNALSYNSSTGVISSSYEENPVFTTGVSIEQPSPIFTLKDTTDDDDHHIYFKNSVGSVVYAIETQNATSGDALTLYSASQEIVQRIGTTNIFESHANIVKSLKNFDVTGNITVSGTVDGRDIASDGSKLDGIASNANNYVLPFTDNSSNWNTAYGWGNHASQGYITNSTASLDASKITGGTLNYARIPIPANGDWWNNGYVRVQTDGVMEVGKYLDFHTADSGGSTDYDVRITASSGAIDIDGDLTVDDVTISGNLTVQGTTTTLNTATLDVEDKNITLNYGTGDTSGSADGAGITIQDAVNGSTDAAMTWNASSDLFNFSHKINAQGDVQAYNFYGQDVHVLNSAGTAWHEWATRASDKVNLDVNISKSAQIHNTNQIYLGSTATANDQLAVNNGTDIFLGTTSKGLRTYKDLHTNAGNNKYWHAGNDGSGSGLDADTLDSYHASTTRNSANTIPVRDSNGYLNLGWINTTSGVTTTASSDYYVNTADGYIRKKTLANVKTEIMGVSSGSSFLRSDATDVATGKITLQYGETSDLNSVGGSRGVTAFHTANVGQTSNRPDSGNYATGLEFTYYDASARSQLAAGSGGSNNTAAFYVRSEAWSATNSWTSWYKLFHTGNDGSGSGLDADTVDGVHATSFLRSDAADTASGNLTFTGNISQTGGAFLSHGAQVSSLTTAWQAAGTGKDRGLYPFRFQNGATGQPEAGDNAHWGLNIYAHSGSSGNYPYGTQLSAGSTQSLWHRWWANGSAQGWRKIWDSANDGTGSGLDADTLDGQHGSYYQPASTAITTANIGSQSVSSASNIDGVGFTNTGSNSGTNANTIDSNGISYYTSGVDNFSGNATDGALFSQRYSSNWQHQIAGDYRSGQIALRGKNNGTWQSWRKVWDASNDGSGSGLDADLLDGQHGSYYEPANGTIFKSRGTVNVTTSSGGSNSNPFDDAHTETKVAEYGARLISYTGASATMLTINTGGSASVFQIGAHYNGNDFYMRTRTDSSNWQTWKKLWHAGNDGTGSGLDADTVDGIQGSSFLRSDAGSTVGNVNISFTGTPSSANIIRFDNASGQTMNSSSGYLSRLEVRQPSVNTDAFMSFHIAGDYAAYFGLDGSTNDFSVGGWSMGANKYKVWHAGNDGTGSGLDADTVDGKHKDFLMHYKGIVSGNWDTIFSQTDGHMGVYEVQNINNTDSNYPTGSYTYGGVLSWQLDNSTFKLYAPHTGTLWYQTGWNNDEYSGWRKIWDNGNDGSGSGLDADLLDGVQGSSYLRSDTNQTFTGDLTIDGSSGWNSGNGMLNVGGTGDARLQVRHIWGKSSTSAGTDHLWLNYANSGKHVQIGGSGSSGNDLYVAGTIYANGYFTGNRVLTTADEGSGQGLDADTVDGIQGSQFLRSDAGDTATGNIVFSGATQYFRKNDATNYTNGSLMVESYGGSSSIAAMGFHISGQLGRMLSMNSAGTLNWEDDVSISGSYFTPNTSANGLKSANGNNFFLPLDAYNNMHIRSTTGSEYHDSTAYYFRKVDQSNLVTITASNTNIAAGTLTRGGNTVWDAGNDGSGSGLDADLLDGMQFVSHLGAGKRQTFTVYGDTDKYYPMVISGNASHISTYKIHRGYSEHGPNDWYTSSHKGGLSFMYNIMGSSGWGGYPTRIHVIEAGEIYSSILGGIALTAHSMKHVVWLRGGGSGGARYHIDSPTDFTLEVNSLTTDSTYKNSTDGWYSYNHSNDSYDVTVNYRTLTERNTAMQNEIFSNMDVYFGNGTVNHQLYGAPAPNKTYLHTANEGSGNGIDADTVDGIEAAAIMQLSATQTITGTKYFQSAVNTSSNNPPLQAYSSGGNGAIMSFHRGGVYAINMGLDSDNIFRIGGWSASTNRLQMDMSGNLTMAGNVTAYSDIRLKENIKVIPNALHKVEQLRGVTFTRNDVEDVEKLHTGVIAQEVEVVLPEAVSEDNNGIKNVAYGNMVGLLIEAVKELKQEVEDLKTQLKER